MLPGKNMILLKNRSNIRLYFTFSKIQSGRETGSGRRLEFRTGGLKFDNMEDAELLPELEGALSRGYGLQPADPADDRQRYAALRAALARRISEWLDADFSRLVNVMYRLDVSEAKFSAALVSGDAEGSALRIADLVLEREKQKIITRRKYRQ